MCFVPCEFTMKMRESAKWTSRNWEWHIECIFCHIVHQRMVFQGNAVLTSLTNGANILRNALKMREKTNCWTEKIDSTEKLPLSKQIKYDWVTLMIHKLPLVWIIFTFSMFPKYEKKIGEVHNKKPGNLYIGPYFFQFFFHIFLLAMADRSD